ncbi:MAG: Peptidase and chymotrypsin/Hap [Pseudonocardiales bacterium]|nr:Peptidase and chymotrypsin/Hap [Pseudonocardiales bacterium]
MTGSDGRPEGLSDGIPDGQRPAEDERFERPNGVAGGFAPHEPLPPAPSPRQPAPPGSAAMFGPEGSGHAFEPAPGDRLPPRHEPLAQPVHPAQADAYGRPFGADSFDAAPGDRIDPGAKPPPPRWWKDDADRDPWRDPSSAFWLGRPALFMADRPIAMGDGEELPEPEPETEEPTEKPSTGRARFGLNTLILVLLVALIAGGVGGGVGWWATRNTSASLRDPDVKLAKVGTPANRPVGSVAEIAKRVGPAVVQIVVRGATESGTGSGVVIDSKGYIVTNNHVVSLAATSGTIQVVFGDDSRATAKIVGRDPATDLAVIKVDHSPLTVASLGDSSKLAVGDPVIAIGSPLGLQGTVTTGIVSALDRAVHVSGEGSDTDAVIDAIQTDAAINPGNSGGALVDASGAVIGIPSAIASLGTSGGSTQSGSIGLGFAIPMNVVSDIAEQLIKNGKAVHATLEASTRSVTDGTRYGAYILQVTPGGAAAKAGLKEGDVIKLFDKSLIATTEDLSVAVSQHKPGDVVDVRYERDGAEQTIKVTLGTDS